MELDLSGIVREFLFDAYRLPERPISSDMASDVFRLMEGFHLNGNNTANGDDAVYRKGDKKVVLDSGKLPKGDYTLSILTTHNTDGHSEPTYLDFILIGPDGKVTGSYRYLYERADGTLRIDGNSQRRVKAEDARKALSAKAYSVVPNLS